MNISALIGGGLGDMIMSMRYLGAIKERYPEAHISLYANDKGISSYSSFIKNHWSYLFDEFTVVGIGSLNYKIRSQFGEEEYYNAYNNITEYYRKQIERADKFYNLISDGLFFLDYHDIPWEKYQRFIPRPNIVSDLQEEFDIIVNLYARENSPSFISKDYSDLIVENLLKIGRVTILAPNEVVKNTFYSKFQDITIVADLSQSLSMIARSKIGLSIDTGIRCFFHSLGKPCYTMSVNCNNYFACHDVYKIRWYPWTESLIPINANPKDVAYLVGNAISNSGCYLFPHLSPEKVDTSLCRKRYD